MSSVYKSIMTGFNEAVNDTKADKNKLKRQTFVIVPVKVYSPENIKRIRETVGMSQKLFAGYLGVSVKTVEAWEAGQNSPSGAASRIINMIEMDNDIIEKYPFVKMTSEKSNARMVSS